MKKHLLYLPIVFLSLFGSIAMSQTNTSVVEGRVADPSGGVIGDCSVVLTSIKTSGALTTRTNETGTFAFPAIPVGSYSLRVVKTGFKAFELSDFRVTLGQHVTQDVVLELGTVSESVTVEAADSALLLEPSSNELGTLIESVNVQQLPLNGRNYLQLGYLSGAAQDAGITASDFLTTQTGHPNRAITIAGTEQDLVGFTVNGISVAGTRLGDLALNVSIAAIDQFKVLQGFIMPAMGPDPGIVNVVTKSGANSFHGEAFEFLRNNDLDARNFFEAQPHPGPFRRNQYGGAMGGPIRRNKIFFFADYEGFRQVLAAPQGGFAPTQDMFKGDFSALPTTIYDPASFNSATGQRQPFSGNIILPGQINPVAQKLLAYYLPGSDYKTRPLNVFRDPVQTQNSDQGGMRVDGNLGSKHTLFGQYMHEVSPVDNPGLFPGSGLFYHNEHRVRDGPINQRAEPTCGQRTASGLYPPVPVLWGHRFGGRTGESGFDRDRRWEWSSWNHPGRI